jgi:hypothetical protein
VPAVFGDGRLLVYGLVKTAREKRQQTTIRLLADSSSGPVAYDVRLDPSQTTGQTQRTVATLTARARIRELEEHPEWIAARGSRQTNRKTNAHVKEIVELSLRYGLMSRETSYVAVERRDTPVLGDIQLRRIPVALTRGWGDVARVGFGGMHSMADAGTVGATAFALAGRVPPRVARRSVSAPRPERSLFSRVFGGGTVPPSSTEQPPVVPERAAHSVPTDPVQRLIALQHADGSWDLTRELAQAVGSRLADLEKALRAVAPVTAGTRQAWATALAVSWLECHAADAAQEWQLLALKARRWLDGVSTAPAGGSWLDAARAELGHLSSSAPPVR